MPAIETDDRRKEYGDLAALDGLSLTVGEGELFALLGPNGSGKTTTIEILTGQRTPSDGSVSVLGIDPVADPLEVRRSIGILPEREDPPSFLTPREYLEFVGDVRSLSNVGDRIEKWAETFAFRRICDTLSLDLSEGGRSYTS
jgi:ABC-2 type transport system ATP-binding protein